MDAQMKELINYDAWADKELLRSISGIQNDEKIQRLVNHLIAAKQNWINRIKGIPIKTIDLWPMNPLSDLPLKLEGVDAELSILITKKTDTLISYSNSKGEIFTNSLLDIVIHIVNHSNYHRGQLAIAIKNVGGNLSVTDYIYWKRKQNIFDLKQGL